MRDILPDVSKWLAGHEPVALATVISTWGSAPRRVGAKMALTPDGKIAGSVSGGCVEAAVFETGVEVLETGLPRLLHFGVADETAWEVGLACGGQIDVFVQPLDPAFFAALRSELESDRPFCTVHIIGDPSDRLGRQALLAVGELSAGLGPGLDELVIEQARQAMAEGGSRRFFVDWEGETLQLFVEVVRPLPTLVIVGGVHTAITLTELAKMLGYHTVIVDPRRVFGNVERFPHASRLIQAWPQEAFSQLEITGETAIVMLTHDPKIDDPALKIALQSPAFYIGALGSRKTQDQRRRRLLAEGLASSQLDRIHGPIGLDIGGETPEEIALAIMAEIVAVHHSPQVQAIQPVAMKSG